MATSSEKLDVKKALEVLAQNGPLALSLKGFEPRREQQEMMRNILDAYNGDHIALIEAGTGTGKSLAYLVPAMLWASQLKERTVISTNTITLQEQLLHKDIPLVAKALNLSVKAVLVKGMQNYLCLRKLSESLQEILLLTHQEAEELQKIDAWHPASPDGSRASLPFSPSPAIWEKVSAESDTCNRNSCPYYQECHFFKARRQANEAQILIANHHLLFADIVLKSENDSSKESPGVMPAYSRLILDEAHNIEDIATEYFASRVSHMDVMRVLARLTSEKGGKQHGKLPLIKERLANVYRNEHSREIASLNERLTIDLPGMRRDLLQQAHELFGAFALFVQMIKAPSEENSPGEGKLRILSLHQMHVYWQERLTPRAKQFIEVLHRYVQSLAAIEADFKHLKNPQLDEQLKGILFEVNALAKRLMDMHATLTHFLEEVALEKKVRWIEIQPLKTMINTALIDANLDISKLLVDYLFSKFSTIVLCSATLTTSNQFHFIRSRLGLNSKPMEQRIVREHIYNSPFNYPQQALMGIPTDIPSPLDPAFVDIAAEKILQLLQVSRGNAFVLFTSYAMLKICYEKVEGRLQEQRFYPLKQGDDDRQMLLNKFKDRDRSVLFGTDSFWEGVDVVGEALRCVILVKLPFKVPSEPLIQARSEAIAAEGKDPFIEYSLPQAIVKFKQGFGRLIRNRRDRGCIICLDNRLITKRYGKLFLNSLPECRRVLAPMDELLKEMTEFYRKTHYLTHPT